MASQNYFLPQSATLFKRSSAIQNGILGPWGVRTKRNVHRLLLSEFPYSVVYEITEDELIVAAVAHAKQRPGYWRKRFN
jgi:hypothetical protein